MNADIKRTLDYLRGYRMDAGQVSVGMVSTMFLEEMERGLSGEESSLMMIPTYIGTEQNIPVGEPVIVLDAGGTNFRVAVIEFDESKKAVITKYKKFPMPGTKGSKEVGRLDFFNRIADSMKDVVSGSCKIGFCFSYPTEIYPSGDGRLIRFVKEVKAPEVEGSMIGENLLEALARKGMDSNKDIVILNDTVATLLAGKAQEKEYSSYVGFILGTGTNCSYIEENSRILKLETLEGSKSQAVNMESGQFSLYSGGTLDGKFRLTTAKPEEGVFEKMISGAYQGPLALTVLKRAAEDKLFSEELGKSLMTLTQLDPAVMDGFLNYPGNSRNPVAGLCKTDSDRIKVYTILDQLIERSAKLTAAHLAGVILKTGRGTDPVAPVCIVADGTTFYKTKALKFRTEFYLKQYLEFDKNRYFEFCHLDDAPLIGAAVAGLLQ